MVSSDSWAIDEGIKAKRESESIRIKQKNPLKYSRIFFDISLKMALL
jgi:hypothetical protein